MGSKGEKSFKVFFLSINEDSPADIVASFIRLLTGGETLQTL